ncbi:hypothetical protein VSH64_08140 [Amycolatopsis rhabdoformis]|uniref:DUF2652 domain-containing protein n=1 Tax=Amycolatopsis rhabdoformis TaxID=1448059 RepID=A0ABZ1IDD2_9PSEU|nr:hypothetical protein [Amycolatopsis rhabdoformis]WSE32076.1 hypothetical protein VSH64_08140 [Amycolatopsis rhabdoformis]
MIAVLFDDGSASHGGNMLVTEFVAHRSSGKSRVFALVRGSVDSLEVVTSVGVDDVDMTEDLVRELNFFLIERDEASLNALLARFPQAVQMAVRAFLLERCQVTVGSTSVFGTVEPVKLMSVYGRELKEFVGAAYLLGLGVNVSNEVDERGQTSWVFELASAEPFVRASEGRRAWLLPDGVPLLSTWTSRDSTGEDVIDHAVGFAENAASRGHWVHLHTFEQGDGESIDSGSTSELVVDVFDVPVPPSEEDSDA